MFKWALPFNKKELKGKAIIPPPKGKETTIGKLGRILLYFSVSAVIVHPSSAWVNANDKTCKCKMLTSDIKTRTLEMVSINKLANKGNHWPQVRETKTKYKHKWDPSIMERGKSSFDQNFRK